MYRNGCISKSSVACRDTSLSDNITLKKMGQGRLLTKVVRVIEVIKNQAIIKTEDPSILILLSQFVNNDIS